MNKVFCICCKMETKIKLKTRMKAKKDKSLKVKGMIQSATKDLTLLARLIRGFSVCFVFISSRRRGKLPNSTH